METQTRFIPPAPIIAEQYAGYKLEHQHSYIVTEQKIVYDSELAHRGELAPTHYRATKLMCSSCLEEKEL